MNIFEQINSRLDSKDRGNNIKTLNTKILNTRTLDTNTQDLPSGESSEYVPAAASGLASLSRPSDSPGEVICSGVGYLPLEKSQIEYLSASLKTPSKNERLEVNVDFKLRNSTQFNKLIFNLMCWDRRREFFDNIRDISDWYGYQEAYNLQLKNDFIGKGRPRQKQATGKIIRSPLKEHTAMRLMLGDLIECHIWIENAYFQIPLYQWSDRQKLFCAKGEYINNTTSKRTRGGWV